MTSEYKDKKNAGKSSAPRFNNAKFVNYELSSDERAACKAWLPNLDAVDDALLKAVEQGYKISVKWDTYSQAFSAFMVTDDSKTENVGIINTGRGSTPLKAIKQALYKHFVVFDLVWSPFAQGGPRTELDD